MSSGAADEQTSPEHGFDALITFKILHFLCRRKILNVLNFLFLLSTKVQRCK